MIYLCKPNRVTRTYLGGHRIDRLRGITASDGFKPEEWIASVTSAKNPGGEPNEGLSVTSDGQLLADILNKNPQYLGSFEQLPILLKLLDASERLVIQAHPTAEYAKANLGSEFGKAECWYIIDAEPGAHVYLGFREGVSREAWIDCFERQDVEKMLSMLHKIDLKAGDVWYVDGGVPHAIGGGCLMAELQEPTDLMVVPERVTPSGRKIAEQRLHCGLGFERMFDVFKYDGYTRAELEAKYHRHIHSAANTAVPVIDSSLTDKFRMYELDVSGEMSFDCDGLPAVAVVLSGCGRLTDSDSERAVKAGDCIFISACSGKLRLSEKLRVIIAMP